MKIRMLGSACLALTMLLAGVATKAQELSAADKAKGLEYLEKTKNDLVEATKGLSEAQWNYKPAPDRWSVAQVMEHIALGEDGFQMMLNTQVMKGPAAPERDLKKTDDAVMAMIPDRSHKAQAPEFLVPKNTFGSGEGSLKHFLESRTKTEDLLKTTPGLRDHTMDSPIGMKLDGYEWILFSGAHSERHLKQILEVKADPGFPKS